ncbi:MAG: bifunctional adenosylcobinamide kinase/adenosylcobinamide-phosphate guanylyltransferase [Cetobacterium sp.]|uniref:bifunctional adenosylcobinamide kinase/adenosylcobinamide-phosphate guanylyltransferase n=1 Tax=Cetobacterium sp. TaxID=2071632 RepID=UPI0025E973D6|nr:bifunctional adenosylcobinamide kinase/adenosylcobinamide-phosphate guanylyltransferase [uncultured Cetobacterium sp.]
MGKIIYITGGARSGKSSFAEKKVFESEKEKIYIATAISFDEEMKERVRLHKIQRGEDWITIEGYKNISNILSEYKNLNKIILLDCLTNMVTNNMIMDRDVDWDKITQESLRDIESEIKNEVQDLIDFIKDSSLDMIVVSNEVGMGLVPPYALGRYFRDIGGRMNQLVAKESDEAYLVVSGLELKLK